MKILEEEEQLHRFIVSPTKEKKLNEDKLETTESSKLANAEETVKEGRSPPLSPVWPSTSEQTISPEGDQIVIHRPWPLKDCVKRRRWRRAFFLSEFGIFNMSNSPNCCCPLVLDVVDVVDVVSVTWSSPPLP